MCIDRTSEFIIATAAVLYDTFNDRGTSTDSKQKDAQKREENTLAKDTQRGIDPGRERQFAEPCLSMKYPPHLLVDPIINGLD